MASNMDSFNSSYGGDTAGSLAKGSPTPAKEAFKVMLKDIADHLSADDMKKLSFFCGNSLEEREKKQPLDLLWDMLRRGKFSFSSLDNLEKYLRRIDRCDLITDYLESFKDQYPLREHGASPYQDPTTRHHSEVSSIGEPMSASSVPPASLTSSRHSYPLMSARQNYPRRQSSQPAIRSNTSVQTSHSRAHGPCSIPEDSETSGKSVVVVGSNQWVRDDNKETQSFSGGNNLTVVSPPTNLFPPDRHGDEHTQTQDKEYTSSRHQAWDSSGASSEFNSQKASPTSLHMQHPPINYETTPPLSDVSATNVFPGLSSAHPPCTSSHSHYSSRFPSSRPVDSLLSSATPSMYSQSDDIIGRIELESSLTSALTFNNLPYANLSADERSGTQPQARGVAVHQELFYSRDHYNKSQSNRTHPGTSYDSFQSKAPSSSFHRPYSDRRKTGSLSARSDQYSSMAVENRKSNSSETSSLYAPRTRTMSESLPIQPVPEMKESRGVEFASLQQSKVYRDVRSYSGSHVLILSSQDIACFIGQILGGVSHEFTIKINVHCKCGKHKDVKMKLIPHKEHHVKSVTLEACLHMPKKCSRHKWLVYFAHSHLHVHTSVTTSEGQEICTASKATPILPMDIPSGHNLTHVTVAMVMPHDMILYKPASRYRLKVTADLLVKGYIEDQSASDYNVVERKFSGGQNETFLEINRKQS